MRLTTKPASQPKAAKGLARNVATLVLHLAPSKWACPGASSGCLRGCLNRAGRGGIFRPGERTNAIQDARRARTALFRKDRPAFLARLDREVRAHVKWSAARGMLPALRLNGTSDLDWAAILAPAGLDRAWDALGVQRYDYTKLPERVRAQRPGYDLTFSRDESNGKEAADLLAEGYRVAVVADAPTMRALISQGAIEGDSDDNRFLEPGGIVALLAKGPAKKDRSGFVVRSLGEIGLK